MGFSASDNPDEGYGVRVVVPGFRRGVLVLSHQHTTTLWSAYSPYESGWRRRTGA